MKVAPSSITRRAAFKSPCRVQRDFSSQRSPGVTYEVTGPFRGNGPSSAPLAFGAAAPSNPPAAEPAGEPSIRLRAQSETSMATLVRRGIEVKVEADERDLHIFPILA